MPEKSEDIIAPEAGLPERWLNPANMLTALRMVLAPPIIALIVYQPQSISWSAAAGFVFLFAALTDKADGYYARRFDAVTRLGQFLDPLADKLLVLPVMVAMAFVRAGGPDPLLPLWVVAVVLARELLISGIRFYGARKGVSFPASWSGKIKMFSQVVVLSVLLFFPSSSNDTFVRVLVFVMAAITVYSGVDYLLRARREIFARLEGS